MEILLGWKSPELDAGRNAKVWPLLANARHHYAMGIGLIEKALPQIV